METKVMIVVEGDLYGRMLAKEFRSKGYGVCGVLDKGEEAVERAKKEQPDTILVEFLLNGNLDGIETAKQIKGSRPISVIFINNCHEQNWVYRADEVNASIVLDKLDAPPGKIVAVVQAAIV